MCVCLFIVTHSLLQCAAACVIAGPSSNVGIDRQPAQPSPAGQSPSQTRLPSGQGLV